MVKSLAVLRHSGVSYPSGKLPVASLRAATLACCAPLKRQAQNDGTFRSSQRGFNLLHGKFGALQMDNTLWGCMKCVSLHFNGGK